MPGALVAGQRRRLAIEGCPLGAVGRGLEPLVQASWRRRRCHGSRVVPLDEQLATLCQRVENQIVGAPCGIMDQMAVICGQAGSLMALLCLGLAAPASAGRR